MLMERRDACFCFIQPPASGRVWESVALGGSLRRSCVLARRIQASGDGDPKRDASRLGAQARPTKTPVALPPDANMGILTFMVGGD